MSLDILSMPALLQTVVSLTIIHWCDSNMVPHTQGPIFVEEPPPKIEYSNTTGVILTCIAHGMPPPEIRWLDVTDKELQYMPRIREVLTNGSLYFPPFRAEELKPDVHSATYRCKAINSAGAILSRYIRLTAGVSREYQVQVEDVFVLAGNVAVLKCSAPSHVQPFLIVTSWQREEPPLGKTTLQPSGRYSITSFGTLHIRDTMPSDSFSNYYCLTLHRLTGERKISLPGKIMVRESDEESFPRIDHLAPVIKVRSGGPADLVCTAKGNPPPVYRWYKGSYGPLQEIVMHPQQSVLHFTSIQPENAGRYVCAVSNKLGEDRREITLSVYVPLNVEVKPSRQVVDAGRDALFNCSISGGEGSIRIFWLKDGQPIHGNDRSLYVRHVRRDDRGMYQCVVRDGDESAQGTAELSLGAMAPELQSTFIEQSLQPGPPISLRCVASGHPPPRITWLLDGAEIVPADYVLGSFLSSSGDIIGHLNISSARVQHGGLYTCIAKNAIGSVSHSAALNIYGPPSARVPRNLTLVSGEEAFLRCPVAGFPIVKVTWRKSGDILPAHLRQRVLSNGTLRIQNIERSADSGEYLCSASNPQGQTAQGRLYLNIMKPPRIGDFHFPGELEENMRVQVSCSIISGDLPISITWHKDGEHLQRDDTVQIQHQEFASSLQFSKLDARHSGNYTCIASNAAASDNFTATLIVSVAPKWTSEPQDISVLYHHTASIHCQAYGFPPPSILWMKNKDELSAGYTPLDYGPHYITYQNGTLVIHSIDLSDEGRYTCQASNHIGTPLSKVIYLKVNVPAHFRSHVVNQSGVAGEPVMLVCEAQGDTPLRVSWTASQWPLAPSRTRIVERRTPGGLAAELHIEQLTRKDGGHYRCMASNDYGQDEMDVYLAVKEPPEAPHNVEVHQAGSRWVTISWVPPFSTLSHYIIQHRQDEVLSSWKNITMSGDARTARLGSLHPDTSYSIRVIAVNEIGASPPSDTALVHTLQEAPSGPPLYVTAEAISSVTITVKWKPPHSSESHGTIMGYQIEYQENGESNPKIKTVRRNKFETVITGLNQYTRYGVTVKAFNTMGPGPASPVVYVTTDEGVPDKPPDNVKCFAASSESLRVQWEPPQKDHHNGVVAGYKVFYRLIDPMNDHSSDVEVKKTTNMETNLHALHKYSNYSVRVLAFTSAGEGVKSDPLYCMTEEDVPGPPAQVKALVMTADSIMVAWTKPLEPNGVIIKYFIYSRSIQPNSAKDIRKDVIFGEHNLTFESRGLHELQRYEFWVTASTSVGEGPSSSKATQSPVSRAPARIAAFSQKVIGVINEDAILKCRTVGLPAPSREWHGPNGQTIVSSVLPDFSLSLHDLKPQHAGNYTCYVTNVFGRDQVTYNVFVQVSPGPPVLTVTDQTAQSIVLQWRVTENGGAPITGYILKYRKDNSEWKDILVEPDRRNFKIEGLKCGTKYQFYLTACNTIGKGKPSPIITASTKGKVPKVPAENNLIYANTTSLTIYLESWPNSGCPIHYFAIEYRAQTDTEWTLVSNSLQAEELVIPALTPATTYIIKIMAYNDAGSSHRDFLVPTRSLGGELIVFNSPASGGSDEFGKFHLQLKVIIPVITAVLFTIAAVICLCIVLTKRQYVKEPAPPACSDKMLVELQNQRNSDQQDAERDSSFCAQKGSDNSGKDDEISPYATFSYPGFVVTPSAQSMDYCMQFRTFSQKECYDAQPRISNFHGKEHKPGYRGKDIEMPCTSNSPPDGLSLEISCISSQQNLGKTYRQPLGPISRSKSTTCAQHSQYDTDSSGEDRKSVQYRKPPRHGCVFEPDSSTESIEASPEVVPKTRARATRRSAASRQEEVVPLQPPRGFSDEQPECDRSSEKNASLQQDTVQQQLTKILNKYRRKQEERKRDNSIHV